MSRAPNLRRVLWIIVVGWAGSSGCIHNHYYGGLPGTMPGCPPVVGQTVTTQVGSVCDVPSGQVVVSGGSSGGVSSNVTSQAPARRSTVVTGPSSRVVISQPAFGPSTNPGSSRFKWRKPDPEAIPNMKAEGALDDSTILR